MPTISQLPSATCVTPSDAIPLSQGGATHSVSVATLLASMQPAVISESGTLLGRFSLGAGGPESVAVGTGLRLNADTLTASGTDHAGYPRQTTLVSADNVVVDSAGDPMLLPVSLLRGLFSAGTDIDISPTGTISVSPTVPTAHSIADLAPVSAPGANDLVAINQGGTDHAISYASFIDGLTIDLAQPAVPTADADTLWVAQSSSTMLRQSFAAVWTWVASKLPSYKLPVVEITHDVTLDATIHNGRVLICSQPLTLSVAILNMGSGFYCDVINLSTGNVILDTGIMTSSGSSSLTAGQAASLRGISYSGGNVVYASFADIGMSAATPGQATGLTAGSPTASSLALNWVAPASGGAVSSYIVQYRIAGTLNWSTFVSGLAVTNVTVIGLTANAAYEFRVFAANGSATGPQSAIVGASTAGAVISITWDMVPSGNFTHGAGWIGVNAHVNPGMAAIQFGFSTSSSQPPATWMAATYVNSDLWGAYVATPASAGTWYAWVEGTDGSALTVYTVAFTVT